MLNKSIIFLRIIKRIDKDIGSSLIGLSFRQLESHLGASDHFIFLFILIFDTLDTHLFARKIPIQIEVIVGSILVQRFIPTDSKDIGFLGQNFLSFRINGVQPTQDFILPLIKVYLYILFMIRS